jgi:hypothetical protein
MISAEQRMTISEELGPRVMQAVDALQFHLSSYGKADAALWRTFLQALHEGAGDEVMNSPLGLAMQMAILGRIENANDASDRAVRKPGLGFRERRQC